MEKCYQHLLSVFVSAKSLLSRLSGVKFETLFSSVANNFHSNSMGWLISVNNKLFMFSLSVSTLLLAILILLYHVKPRFQVNDLLHNRIRKKRIEADNLRLFLLSDCTRIDNNEYLSSLENGTELIVCTGEQIEKLSIYFDIKRYLRLKSISYPLM